MKKNYLFLSSILFFLFASCSIFEPAKGSLSVYIDGNNFSRVAKASSDKQTDSIDEVYTVTLEVSGFETITKEFNRTEGTKLSVEDINEGTVVNISLSLSYKDEVLYKGSRENYVVLAGANPVEIVMYPTESFNPYRDCYLNFDEGFESVISTRIVKKNYVLTEEDLIISEKEGYEFIGWFAGEESVEAGYTVTENTTITAKWNKIKTVTITYILDNDSEFETKTVVEGYVITDEDLPVKERDGYEFIGWFSGENLIEAGFVVNEDISFTAKFNKVNYFTITFNADDGSELVTKTVKEGYCITSEDLAVKEKEGYIFLGWYAGEEYIQVGYEITSDVILTAKWLDESTPTFTINYLSDYGTTLSARTVMQDYVLKDSDLVTLEEEGYTFLGWYIGDELIQSGYVVTSDITLTAKWKELQNVTITFDLLGDIDVYTKTVKEGYVITEYDLTVNEREGYTFLGWYAGEKLVEPGYVVTENVTLTAKWIKGEVKTFTIKYLSEFGAEVAEKIVVENYKLTEEDLVVLTDDNYKFLGWYIDEELVEPGYVVTENVVLTAKWEKVQVVIPTVTLTIDKGLGETAVVKTVDKGYKLTAEDLESLVDEEDKWTFDGWFIDDVLVTEGYEITKDTVLTAKWTKIPYYTVSYINALMEPPASKEYKTGYKLLNSDLPDCRIEGYTFIGWYSGDELVNAGDEVTSDLELVAKWEAIAPEITMILRKNGQECEKTGEKFMLSELDYLQLEIVYDTTIHQENSLVFQFKINDEVIESTKHTGLQLSELLSRDKLEAKDYKLTVSIKVDGLDSTENVAELSFTFVENGSVTPVIGLAIPNYYIKKEFDGEKIYTFTVTVSDVDGAFADNSTFTWKLNGKVIGSAENSLECVIDLSTDDNLQPGENVISCEVKSGKERRTEFNSFSL